MNRELQSLRSEQVRQQLEMNKKNKQIEDLFGPRNPQLDESKLNYVKFLFIIYIILFYIYTQININL